MHCWEPLPSTDLLVPQKAGLPHPADSLLQVGLDLSVFIQCYLMRISYVPNPVLYVGDPVVGSEIKTLLIQGSQFCYVAMISGPRENRETFFESSR